VPARQARKHAEPPIPCFLHWVYASEKEPAALPAAVSLQLLPQSPPIEDRTRLRAPPERALQGGGMEFGLHRRRKKKNLITELGPLRGELRPRDRSGRARPAKERGLSER
jgi:hypothetical protein